MRVRLPRHQHVYTWACLRELSKDDEYGDPPWPIRRLINRCVARKLALKIRNSTLFRFSGIDLGCGAAVRGPSPIPRIESDLQNRRRDQNRSREKGVSSPIVHASANRPPGRVLRSVGQVWAKWAKCASNVCPGSKPRVRARSASPEHAPRNVARLCMYAQGARPEGAKHPCSDPTTPHVPQS